MTAIVPRGGDAAAGAARLPAAVLLRGGRPPPLAVADHPRPRRRRDRRPRRLPDLQQGDGGDQQQHTGGGEERRGDLLQGRRAEPAAGGLPDPDRPELELDGAADPRDQPEPAPGTRVAKQTVVTLTVSTGKPKTTVPTLVNLPLGQAQTDLANANLQRADAEHQLGQGPVRLGHLVLAGRRDTRARRLPRDARTSRRGPSRSASRRSSASRTRTRPERCRAPTSR